MTEIYSDKEGRLTGQLERGGRVTLHCPIPHVFLGKRNIELLPSSDKGFEELAKGLLAGDLVRQAREDRDHYYLILDPQSTRDGIFAIPYLVF